MSLYDNPLPPADYAAYLALREEMCDLALPYLGHYLECQKALLELKMFLAVAIRNLGNFPDGVAFAILIANGLVPLIDPLTQPRYR